MPGILEGIKLLRDTFDKYAGKEGDKDTLTKRELAEMLRTEFGIMEKGNAEKDFFSTLDNDCDGVVNFQEYITFVASLSCIITS